MADTDDELQMLKGLANLVGRSEADGQDQRDRGLGSSYSVAIRRRYSLFCLERDYAEGDLVQWKRGMRNRRWPEYGEVAIVVKLLEAPIYDNEKNSGSPLFREPLDLIIGLLDRNDDEFLAYYVDGRRFCKAQ